MNATQRTLRREAAAELAARLLRDQAELERRFAPPASRLGAPMGTDLGLGDPHDGGRQVAAVTFASGVRLVYKPRPVGPEAVWHGVVAWVNQMSTGPALLNPRVLERDGYGWTEHVPARAPAAPEAAEFLARAGALLALFDVLEVRDAHRDNVLASGPHPVLVDAETVAHPRFAGWEDQPSLLLTGFLGWPGAESTRRRDPSGLRRGVSAALRRPAEVAAGLEAGYGAVHDLLRREGRGLLEPGAPLDRLRGERVRAVLRPTRRYRAPLDDDLPLPPEAIPAARACEDRAVARGDVPVFRVAADGVDLHAEGRLIPRCFPRSGLERVAARLRGLDARDRDANVAALRALVLVGSLGG